MLAWTIVDLVEEHLNLVLAQNMVLGSRQFLYALIAERIIRIYPSLAHYAQRGVEYFKNACKHA